MRFYRNLLLLSLPLVGVLALLQSIFGWYQQGNVIWFALGFYVFLTIGTYEWTLRARKLKNSKFVGRFFIATGLRIILCGLFLAIYLIISDNRDKIFVVTFMMLYLFYTLFEIFHLVTKLRPEKNRQVDSTNH